MFELVKLHELNWQSIKATAIKLHWEKSQLVNVQDSNSLKLTSFTVSDVIVNQGCIQTLYGLELLFKRDFYDG
jgi:hypothetical protein